MVAGLRQAAVLVQLPGANFAAAAAVQDDADAGCALGHLQRAFTHGWAGGGGGGGEDLRGQRYNLLTRGIGDRRVYCPPKIRPLRPAFQTTAAGRDKFTSPSGCFFFEERQRNTHHVEASEEEEGNSNHQHLG